MAFSTSREILFVSIYRGECLFMKKKIVKRIIFVFVLCSYFSIPFFFVFFCFCLFLFFFSLLLDFPRVAKSSFTAKSDFTIKSSFVRSFDNVTFTRLRKYCDELARAQICKIWWECVFVVDGRIVMKVS